MEEIINKVANSALDVFDLEDYYPKGMRVQELPAPFASHTHWADLSCTFSKQGNRVVMKKEYVIKNRRVALKDIPAWNKMVSEWNDACNEQVVLQTK